MSKQTIERGKHEVQKVCGGDKLSATKKKDALGEIMKRNTEQLCTLFLLRIALQSSLNMSIAQSLCLKITKDVSFFERRSMLKSIYTDQSHQIGMFTQFIFQFYFILYEYVPDNPSERFRRTEEQPRYNI